MRNLIFVSVCVLIIIASCTKKSSPSVTWGREKHINAALLFSDNCARCHGANGTGGKAPNLSKISLNKGDVAGTITSGRGRMPSFSDSFTQKEIAALADFVLALKK